MTKPIPKLTQVQIEAFWNKVDIGSHDKCWPYKNRQPGVHHNHYIGNYSDVLAHRLAWSLSNKADPGDLLVCHTCDNPSCCNPNHLFIGTASDNNNDAIRKGRSVDNRGSKHGNSKLTEQDIETIRHLKLLGYSQREISDRMGIHQSAVSRILARKRWRHV